MRKLKRWSITMGSLHFRYEGYARRGIPTKKVRDMLPPSEGVGRGMAGEPLVRVCKPWWVG